MEENHQKQTGWHKIAYELALVALIAAIGLFLIKDLLHPQKLVQTGDVWGLSEWTYYLKVALSQKALLPSWSHLWCGGIPFFGIVPPFNYFLFAAINFFVNYPIYSVQYATVIFFVFAGISFYFFAKDLTKNTLAAFVGAIIYMAMPVHIGSLVVMGMTDLMVVYALAPLILLTISRAPKNYFSLFWLIILGCIFLLTQIEAAFIYFVFLFAPYLIFTIFSNWTKFKKTIASFITKPSAVFLSLFTSLTTLAFYISTIQAKKFFSFHDQTYIYEGRSIYSMEKISDLFHKAKNAIDLFQHPQTEYYLGAVLLTAVLGFIVALLALKTAKKEKQALVFFLIVGSVSLWACFSNLWGTSTFYSLPFIKEMRVPFRFFYILAMVVALFNSYLVTFLPKFFKQNQQIYSSLVLAILILLTIRIDFKPYFSFYKDSLLPSAVEKDFCQEIYASLPKNELQTPKRIFVYSGLNFPHRCASEEQNVETLNNWLRWNQTALQTKATEDLYRFSDEYKTDPQALGKLKDLSVDYLVLGQQLTQNIINKNEVDQNFDKIAEEVNSSNNFELIQKAQTQNSKINVYKVKEALPKAYITDGENIRQVEINSMQFSPNGFNISLKSDFNGSLVLSYFDAPWWKITDNSNVVKKGGEHPYFINFPISQGKHTITLTYNYPFRKNAFYSLFASIAASTAVTIYIRSTLKKNYKQQSR